MDWIEEFHSVFKRVWNEDVHRDCRNRRIRTERDMVASMYHHLRADKWFAGRENTEEDLKITLEKDLETSNYIADLMVRRNGEWLAVMECKLHINTRLRKDVEDVLKDLDSLGASRTGGRKAQKPKRTYLCYLLKAEGKPVEQLNSHLDSFEHELSEEMKWEPAPGYLWVVRGIRVSIEDEKKGEDDWTGLDSTWQVLPWGGQESGSRL